MSDVVSLTREGLDLVAKRKWAAGVVVWRQVLIHHHREMASEEVFRALRHLDLCRAWAAAPEFPAHGCAGSYCRTVGCANATPTLSNSVGWDGLGHD